ncbi:glycoside hydrolase family 3 C-terminal domain-containing protein [Yinghuangia sp. YIM S10712]|uniref:glycoside hydrolase family 3 protein n=1 Tax=Yinghuangia sp. YIM S10712 TaxID=3436930 RepID=UPI003F53791F
MKHPPTVDVPTAFETAVAAVRAGDTPETQAKLLFEELSAGERLWLLDGDTPFWEGTAAIRAEGYNARPYVHGAVDRLGIPGTRFVDGPRGCVAGRGTAFPVPMARGATWDVALEEQVGEVIGREIRAQGGNFFGGVCVNLPRHPSWGRAQETYGDDPHHLGEFGAALTRGTQKYVMACVKHFALNSMENARFKVDVTVEESVLHDIYLPHFKRIADAGVDAVMTAYNSVNGEWAGQNQVLLTEVLRDLWDWRGITVSDFVMGLRDAAKSLNAGLDLEEPFAQQRAAHLARQLEAGETSWEMVERAGLRLLAAQLRSYARRVDGDFGPDTMASAESRALARTVAARSMVLLKNDDVDGVPVLPLEPSRVGSIALIGRLAVAANMGDHGSSDVRPPAHCTPLDGITAAFPDAVVTVVSDDDPEAAATAARQADVAIVVAGYDAADEGEYIGPDVVADPRITALIPPPPPEIAAAMSTTPPPDAADAPWGGGDRASLTLREIDERIIRAVSAANPRTAVAVVAAGAVTTEAWRHEVPAVLLMWYAGMEGGHALADVLTGAHNPTGRLPFSVPVSADHLPPHDRDATAITYGRLHGQRLLDHLGVDAAFPHGFGLSYTTFVVTAATALAVDPGSVRLRVDVANTGTRDGRHVVQVYGRRTEPDHADETALLGFACVDIVAGATASVDVDASLLPLARWDSTQRRRVLPGINAVALDVGAHARDPHAVAVPLASDDDAPSPRA